VLAAPITVGLKLFGELRVADGAHGLGQTMATAPIVGVSDARRVHDRLRTLFCILRLVTDSIAILARSAGDQAGE
jgi:hypothetical protein